MAEVLEENNFSEKYLTFQLDNETYGIELENVVEIIGMQPITKLPGLPDYVRGIINLRGKIIPVMDVRLRFNKNLVDYNERTCVIVININDLSTGLIVDNVSEVISIPKTEIIAPQGVVKENNRFIKGLGKVGDDVKLLLDCEKLLNN